MGERSWSGFQWRAGRSEWTISYPHSVRIHLRNMPQSLYVYVYGNDIDLMNTDARTL